MSNVVNIKRLKIVLIPTMDFQSSVCSQISREKDENNLESTCNQRPFLHQQVETFPMHMSLGWFLGQISV